MGIYINEASVRRTVGVSTIAEIEASDVNDIIRETEAQIPRFFNTVFTPTEKIEIFDGDRSGTKILENNPLLAVRELKINGTTVTPANIHVYKEPGMIQLGTEAEKRTFSIIKPLDNVVRYIYGNVINSDISTTSTAATTTGTSVAISVSSESDFKPNDWVEILGMDGFKEVAQISSVASNTITVDQLVYTHVSGSTINKLVIDETFKKLMNIIASISIVARIIGQSAKDIVGYSLTEFQVQKGEPYTQWRETAIQLIKQRDEIYKRMPTSSYIV